MKIKKLDKLQNFLIKLGDFNLSGTEYKLIIFWICQSPDFNPSVSVFSRELGIDRRNISKILKFLKDKGIIKHVAYDAGHRCVYSIDLNMAKLKSFKEIDRKTKRRKKMLEKLKKIEKECQENNGCSILKMTGELNTFVKIWMKTYKISPDDFVEQIPLKIVANDTI